MSEFQFTNPDSNSGRIPQPDFVKKPLGFQSLTTEEWEWLVENATKLCPSRLAKGVNDKLDPEWIEVKVNEITGDRAVTPKLKLKV